MSWLGTLQGWTRRKTKFVTGTSAGFQTNYQLKITIHKGSGLDGPTDAFLGGNCLDNFGDIRFTDSDGMTLINYWIESISGTGNTAIANIWVNIPNIPASPAGKNIYIYYNNPVAITTSDGSGTFIFYDNFDRPNGTPGNGWIIDSGNWSINGGVLQVSDGGGSGQFIRRASTTMVGIWEWKQRTNFNTFANRIQCKLHFIVPGTAPTTNSYQINTLYGESLRRFEKDVNGAHTIASVTSPTLDTVFHNYRIIRDNSGNITRYIDEVIDGTTVTWTDLSSSTNIYLSVLGPGAGGIFYIDDIRVRKYASPEPTFGSSGNEEFNITATDMSLDKTSCAGSCIVNAYVTWYNYGNSDIANFTPTILIDGTTQAYGAQITIPSLGSASSGAITSPTLLIGNHSICPVPN